MKRYVTFFAMAVGGALIGCSPALQINADSEAVTPAGYAALEQQLIEDYLTLANPGADEDAAGGVVKVYNVVDRLEYEGTPEDEQARLFMLKCDFLFQVDQTAVYRLAR